MSTNHYARAEELLAKAAELEDGPRHTISKTYASMAQAHAILAQTKALREQSAMIRELLAPPAIKLGDVDPTCPCGCGLPYPKPDSLVAIPEPTPPRRLGDAPCKCITGDRGEICPEHDQPLDMEVKP